jgi:hypothetical protein
MSPPHLGFVNFAPNGKWGEANTVKTGDYSTMLMEDNLIEPNWDYSLTKLEAEILGEFDNLSLTLWENAESDDDSDNTDDAAKREIADKYGITPENIDELLYKYFKMIHP